MSVELDVQALAKDAGSHLTVPQLHDLLRRIADRIGSRPREVTGPGPELVWALGERGITVRPSSFRGTRRVWVDAFDWKEQDDENYRTFKYAMSLSEVPYLWSLSIAGGATWAPGDQVATTWAEFFAAYEPCMNKMPGELALLPPEWLPADPVVTSLWNIEGSRTGSVAVSISAAGVDLFGEAYDGYLLEMLIPADRLTSGEVSVPAMLAGMTATGDYREMQFFDNELASWSTYPRGVQAGDPDYPPEALQPGLRPPKTQSVEEVQALLDPPAAVPAAPTAPAPPPAPVGAAPVKEPAPAAPGPPPVAPAPPPPAASAKSVRQPFWRRRAKPSATAFVATMPVTHALELATQLASNNHDSPAVLAGWGVVLGDSDQGVLDLGNVRCRRDSVGYRVWVELMPAGRAIDDAPGALAYAEALSESVSRRYGQAAVTWVEADRSGNWGWKIGQAGLGIEAGIRGVMLVATPDGEGLLQRLREGVERLRSI